MATTNGPMFLADSPEANQPTPHFSVANHGEIMVNSRPHGTTSSPAAHLLLPHQELCLRQGAQG